MERMSNFPRKIQWHCSTFLYIFTIALLSSSCTSSPVSSSSHSMSNSPQTYEYHPYDSSVKRHLQDEAYPLYRPIRISAHYIEGNLQLTSFQLKVLKTMIIPKVIGKWQNALRVIPVAGPLVYEPRCAYYERIGGPCTKYHTENDCLYGNIPYHHLGKRLPCEEGKDCPPDAPNVGVPKSDYILYISAKQLPQCQPSPIAQAGPCSYEQYGRPTHGAVNVCPSLIPSELDDAQIKTTTSLLTHELGHALGFVSNRFRHMRDRKNGGQLRSPSGNNDDYGSNKDCPIRPANNRMRRSSLTVDDNKAVQLFHERGHDVYKVVTPKVVEFVRSHFNCPTLNGAELYMSDTDCVGSHWSPRMFFSEVMNPSVESYSALSPLTLAFFDDSGWYKVNYNASEPLLWGKNKGCAFAEQNCVQPDSNGQYATVDSDTFCTKVSEQSCTFDYKRKGVCDLVQKTTNDIPREFAYFGSGSLGGRANIDYCPIVMGFSNGDCTSSIGTDIDFAGETRCEDCRCAVHSLSSHHYSNSRSSGGCFKMRCIPPKMNSSSNKQQVVISIAQQNRPPTEVVCLKKGDEHSVEGYQGKITCPDPDIICQ